MTRCRFLTFALMIALLTGAPLYCAAAQDVVGPPAPISAPAPAPVQKPIPTTPLAITSDTEIIAAFAISQGISALVEKVNASDCPARVQAEPAATLTCPCQFNDDIETLRVAYDTALSAHPHWKDRLLTFKEPVTRAPVTLGLPAIRKQIESCGQRAL